MSTVRNDSGQIFKGIKKTKTRGNLGDFPKAIKTINSKLSAHFCYVATSISKINKVVDMANDDFFRELVWQCNVIQSQSEVINNFVSLKAEYSKHVLNSNMESALETLKKLQNQCGWSLWLIEAKFFCLHQINGLEGNKAFLEEIYYERNMSGEFDIIYYLSFLISERNEDGCQVSDLYRRIHTQLAKVEGDEFSIQLKNVVNYVVFNDVNNKKHPDVFLKNFHVFTAIDMYELLLRIFVEFKPLLNANEVKLPLRILTCIRDKRLGRIAYRYGLNNNWESDNLADSNLNSLEFPQVYNELVKLGHKFESSGHYIKKYNESIQSIIRQDSNFDVSTVFLSQFSVNFKHIDEIYTLLDIPSVFLNVSEVHTVKSLSHIYGKVLLKNELEDVIRKIIDIDDIDSCLDILNLLRKNQYELDIGNIPSEMEYFEISDYIKSHTLIINFHYLIKSGYISESFRLFVDLCIVNPNVKKIFRLPSYLQGKKWKFYKDLDSYIDSAIILEAYTYFNYDEKQIFNLKACSRSFMKDVNVTQHSKLTLYHFNGHKFKYRYFLEKICTLEIIGSDANSFSNERDIKLERIAVCNLLLESELISGILEERDTLERSIAISDGLNEVETAGLTVDQNRFKSVANNLLKNDFGRYKSFMALEKSRTKHHVIEDKISSSEHMLITKPLDQGDNILVKLVRDLGDMFLKNQEFGLDYYLSMRVRHGRLMGISRGPLERRKLVTKFSEKYDKYLDNEYWFNKYNEILNFEDLVELNKILCDFSRCFDSMMRSFKNNQVQIKSDDIPDGMFFINITLSSLEIMKEDIKEETNMDEFLDYIVEYFLLLVDQSSANLKEWIESTLKKEVNNELYNLQNKIDKLIRNSSCSISPINSEITSARTELNNTLDDISAWFDISSENKTSIRTYSLENIVEISLSRTKQVYQMFDPIIREEHHTKNNEFHSSLLALLVDAFTIIFSNIYVHGLEEKAAIDVYSNITIDEESEINLNVIISNDIDIDIVDFDRLEKIKAELQSHKLKARQEGGSGFHKLAAMPIVLSSNDLDFGYKNDSFYVDINFSLSKIY